MSYLFRKIDRIHLSRVSSSDNIAPHSVGLTATSLRYTTSIYRASDSTPTKSVSHMVVQHCGEIATRTDAGGALHEIKTRLLNIVVGTEGCTFLNATDE